MSTASRVADSLSLMKKESSSSLPMRRCLVCSARSDSAHFGVDCCRACAAFFRRSLVLEAKYVCRQGTQRCAIGDNIRSMCRFCRLAKCYASGMHPSNVHRKNSKFSSAGREQRQSPAEISSSTLANGHGSTNAGEETRNRLKSEVPSSPSDHSPIRSCDGTTILDRVRLHYNTLCSARLACELPCGSGDGPQPHMRTATFLSLNGVAAILERLLPDFARLAFDEFEDLEPNDKWSLIKNFATVLFVLESAIRSYELFGGEPNLRVMSYTSYVDLEQLDHFFSNAPERLDRQEAARVMRSNFEACTAISRPLVEKAGFSTCEVTALLTLSFWPTMLPQGSARIRDISASIHERVFNELDVYYRSSKLTGGPAVRFSFISQMLLYLQFSVSRIREDVEMYRLMNVFDGNSSVYNIIN